MSKQKSHIINKNSVNKNVTPPTGERYGFTELIEVMRALRDPEHGCPWDLEQNFSTIAPYTIEEAYEVADAIDRNDMDDLKEELGDLLLQPLFHAQMAKENGSFDIHDVINAIAHKMISRHPHVFDDRDAHTAADVNAIWDERKKAEKPSAEDESILDSVTKGLPALLRAQKLQKKAAKTGFEWPRTEQILDKLEEEIAEMRAALKQGDPLNQIEEIGDILFVLVNLARKYDINAEEALRQSNQKFERRFKGIEQDFKTKGKDMATATLEELEQSWSAQKEKERR